MLTNCLVFFSLINSVAISLKLAKLTTKPMQFRSLFVTCNDRLCGIVSDNKISSADCKNCMRYKTL